MQSGVSGFIVIYVWEGVFISSNNALRFYEKPFTPVLYTIILHLKQVFLLYASN